MNEEELLRKNYKYVFKYFSDRVKFCRRKGTRKMERRSTRVLPCLFIARTSSLLNSLLNLSWFCPFYWIFLEMRLIISIRRCFQSYYARPFKRASIVGTHRNNDDSARLLALSFSDLRASYKVVLYRRKLVWNSTTFTLLRQLHCLSRLCFLC